MVSLLHLTRRSVNIAAMTATQHVGRTPRARGRTYRGASARQRRDERRARLVEAAVELFGTSGYRTATVDRICAVAGLTKRYFYESFDDSEQLLLAAYAQVIEDLGVHIGRATRTAGPGLDAQARAALTAMFRVIDEDPRVARIAFVEVLGVSAAVDDAYRAATHRFADTLVELADATLGPGRPGRTNRHILATGLVGAVVFIAQQWILTDRREPIASVVHNAHTIVMATLERAATARTQRRP